MDIDIQTIVTIVLGAIAILSSVSWLNLWSKVRSIRKNIREFVDVYKEYQSDGDGLNDTEKAKLFDILIDVFSDLMDIFQALNNVIMKILDLVAAKRTLRLQRQSNENNRVENAAT